VTGRRPPETVAEGRARRARWWAKWRRPATAAALIGYGLVVAAFYIIAARTGRTDLLQPRHPGFYFLAGFPYWLIILGIYWALFDHDEPPPPPGPR
jgi:hypothetical protein